jgi:hypothetical protein
MKYFHKKDNNECQDAPVHSNNESLEQKETERLKSIKGIGAKWALNLQRAGIKSIEDLSEMTPEVVRMKLDQLISPNKNKQIHIPNKITITEWIINASYIRQNKEILKDASRLYRFMYKIGINPEPFKPYNQNESLENEIITNKKKLQIIYKTLLHILLYALITMNIAILCFGIIYRYIQIKRFSAVLPIYGYLLRHTLASLGFMIFHIGENVIVIILAYIIFSIHTKTYYNIDYYISKLIFKDKGNVHLFVVRWYRASDILNKGVVFYATSVIFIIFLMYSIILPISIYTTDSLLIFKNLQAVLFHVVLIFVCTFVGLKSSISDSLLFKWIENNPKSSTLAFGLNVNEIHKYHILIIIKRAANAVVSLIFLAFNLILVLIGVILISFIDKFIFIPAINSWYDFIGYKIHFNSFYDFIGYEEYIKHGNIDLSAWISNIPPGLIGILITCIFILCFFHIVMPYFINKGKGAFIIFIIVVCMGFFFDLTLSKLQIALKDIGKIYYVLTFVCIYLIFKLMKSILSKKAELILSKKIATFKILEPQKK